MKLKTLKRETDQSPDFSFFCPGCRHDHHVWVERPNRNGAAWKFNGDMERPTFEPSIKLSWHQWEPPVTPENHEEYTKKPWEQKQVAKCCHFFIREGRIEYCGDCTHQLAGQVVPMVELAEPQS